MAWDKLNHVGPVPYAELNVETGPILPVLNKASSEGQVRIDVPAEEGLHAGDTARHNTLDLYCHLAWTIAKETSALWLFAHEPVPPITHGCGHDGQAPSGRRFSGKGRTAARDPAAVVISTTGGYVRLVFREFRQELTILPAGRRMGDQPRPSRP